MAPAHSVAEAFRRLQAGDAAGALEAARGVLSTDGANARAFLAEGIALRMAGKLAEAMSSLARAQQLDPRDHAAAYEEGVVHHLQGKREMALDCFDRSAALRPEFFAAPFSAGIVNAELGRWDAAASCFRRVLQVQPGQAEALLQLALALGRAGRHGEADATFVQALATHPGHAAIIRAFGQYSAARGNFARAASLFAEAMRVEPADEALPMYHAQCELILGRWRSAWASYSRRASRRRFERDAAAIGRPYAVPSLEAVRGRRIAVIAEQGLGDVLFFLRWAPTLRAAGAALEFVGEPRLHGLLARTSLFERFGEPLPDEATPILVADLPLLFPGLDPLGLAPIPIAPLSDRVSAWQARLQALGPRPWIGTQWRAGTPRAASDTALSKEVPVEALFPAIAGLRGTLFALQRGLRGDERELATRAAGRVVHDLSAASDELEDTLAVVSILDRHLAVSSTALHLAAAAGAAADVLVPFPPEWRWRTSGESPWFPRMRVHRQGVDGDWSEALASAARGAG